MNPVPNGRPQLGADHKNGGSSAGAPLPAEPPATPAQPGQKGAAEERRSSVSSGNSDEVRAAISSNADYDHIRDTTLMFFLDRLFISSQEGVEVRTLHDLSCLFGTRGFTKEMRQIVGASRNGLKKFLQSYPSLFTVDGDQVYLAQLRPNQGAAPARDYNKEAVEYFSQKLQQFGASLVPIKNLFGYRSQASQEVRHVSGKNSKEFKQFLLAHQHVFELLADEHVVLKSAMRELESRGETHESLRQTLQQPAGTDEVAVMDSYLNKQFASSIAECLRRVPPAAGAQTEKRAADTDAKLEAQRPTEMGTETEAKTDSDWPTIEQLHAQIIADSNNQLFVKMVKTTEDLKVFLRMHPKIFRRFARPLPAGGGPPAECVALVTSDERRQLDRHSLHAAQESLVARRQSRDEPGERLASLPVRLAEPSSRAELERTSQGARAADLAKRQPGKPGQQQQQQPRATGGSESGGKPPVAAAGATLRATAPPFVPAKRLAAGQFTVPLPGAPRTLQRSASNLVAPSRARGQDPRSTLRSYLMEAAACNNQTNGVYSTRKLSNGTLAGPAVCGPRPLIRQSSALTSDDLRSRIINIGREASSIITRVMNTTDAVALDCEGYNLGFNGQITLIQFAFIPRSETKTINNNNEAESDNKASAGLEKVRKKPEVCVFDLLAHPELAYCLKPLLESEQTVKIVHDVRNKSNALYQEFGIMLNHVFDTQVANLVIQQQETGKPAYKSRYISMSKLCDLYGEDHLIKYRNAIMQKPRHSGGGGGSHSGQSKRNKDVNYWRQRPLTESMVYEATMDVYCLVGGVYQNLKAKIKPEYWPLFVELNREGVLARIKPEEIKTVKKERKVDLEVIDLKRKLYSDSVRSIVLSNREIRLLRHVDLTEEVRQKIQQCKKVAKKLERLDMKAAQNAQMLLGNTSQLQPTGSEREEKEELTGSLNENEAAATEANEESARSNGSSRKQSTSTTSHESSESWSSRPIKTTNNDSIQDNEIFLVTDTGNNRMSDSNKAAITSFLENEDTGLGSLFESSMFDELKDKMIESSSLLESLEDDEDDIKVCAGMGTGKDSQLNYRSLSEHSTGHDSTCTCQCHSLEAPNQGSSETNNTDKSTRTSSPSCTKAVDMAIQCDLIN